MKKQLLLPFFSLLAVVLLLAGCGDDSQSFTLLIECDSVVAKTSVEVDIFAVYPSDKERVMGSSVDDHWEPANKSKRNGIFGLVTKQFGTGQTNKYVMSLKEPEVRKKWDAWKVRGATDLIVVADLPLKSSGKGATVRNDVRCVVIPLKAKELKELYPKAKAFRILVQESSVSLEPLTSIPK